MHFENRKKYRMFENALSEAQEEREFKVIICTNKKTNEQGEAAQKAVLGFITSNFHYTRDILIR